MDVLIESAGMASCLGGLVQGCAAFRAGIRRKQASLEAQYQPQDELARQPITACALPVSTFGFSGIGRLVSILHEVLVDLEGHAGPEVLEREAALFLALPDPVELDLPVGEALEDDLPGRVKTLGERVLSLSLEAAGTQWSVGPSRFFHGRVGFAEALQAAVVVLERRKARRCLVAAADTLVDGAVLERLMLEGRLKTEDNPVGCLPGEGGAAFVLRAEARGGAAIRDISVYHGPAGNRPGRALADCVDKVARSAASSREPPLLLSDLDGEPRSAEEWGGTLVRLRELGAVWASPQSWFPVNGFGDTGAARPALALCAAMQGFERGYAPGKSAVVLAGGEQARAAVLVAAVGS